jgi:hypothetical protein
MAIHLKNALLLLEKMTQKILYHMLRSIRITLFSLQERAQEQSSAIDGILRQKLLNLFVQARYFCISVQHQWIKLLINQLQGLE